MNRSGIVNHLAVRGRDLELVVWQRVAVHADDGEWIACKAPVQRPLVRHHFHAGFAPGCPEDHQGYLATRVGEFHWLVFNVVSRSLGNFLTDAEMADLEEQSFGGV